MESPSGHNGERSPELADLTARAVAADDANLCMLVAVPPGSVVLLAVTAPLAPHPGGGLQPDFSRLAVCAPEMQKQAVTLLEGAVEHWAEVARKQQNAGRLIVPS